MLIYADTEEELFRLEEEVLRRLYAAGLPVDIKKSEFNVTTTKFLGLIIRAGEGVAINPEKITAVTELKTPEDLGGLRSAIGLFA